MAKTQKETSHHSCVRLVPIFNHLDDASMDMIGSKARPKVLNKGEFLYHAKDQDDSLYIVSQGKIRIYLMNESGKEQLIRIMNPGDFMGEWTIFNSEGVHEEYAEALKDTKVCMIKREDIQDLLIEHPEISMRIMGEMSNRLAKSEKQTAKVSSEMVSSRLALYLAELVEDGDQLEDEVIVDLDMSRKDIASFLGTSPESISRKFKELEDNGLIEQISSKKIRIYNLDDLILYEE